MPPQPFPLRRIHVLAVRKVTPRTVRVTFGGDDLSGLRLAGPDQQVKLYFPRPADRPEPVLPPPDPDGDVMRWYAAYGAIPEAERPWMRSYTLRAHDPLAATVTIDFFAHEGGTHGPATRWALAARPGDTLGMFGPSAYFAKPVAVGAADWTLLVADGCSLPALATLAGRCHRATAHSRSSRSPTRRRSRHWSPPAS
jgi:NADPH-dependent ferric siderophore reductase